MMHGTARAGGPMGGAGVGTAYDSAANRALITGANVTSMITRLGGDPSRSPRRTTRCRRSRSARSARHPGHDQHRSAPPLPVRARRERHRGQFSQWPETLGFAALGDAALDAPVRRHRAAGVSRRRHPHGAVAASRPRHRAAVERASTARSARTPISPAAWCARTSRASSTALSGVDSCAVLLTVVKHWVGYGAAKEGFDSHNYVRPLRDVLRAEPRRITSARSSARSRRTSRGVMPTYSILEGAT